MDKTRLSIIHQKATGTYQRNQQIRRLVREGESMAQVGRWFNLPRQTIRRIVNEPGEE
jgi:DNA-binding NarL/FixJ family response regulator